MPVTCFMFGFFFLNFHFLFWRPYARLMPLCQQPGPLLLAGTFALQPIQVGGNFDWLAWRLSEPAPLCPPGTLALS